MKVKGLVTKKKPKYTLRKPDDIPPHSKNCSEFFVAMAIASRGSGKSYSICSLIQHMGDSGFYNRYVSVSPTRESDLKQADTFEQMEEKGYCVELYDELTNEVMDDIQERSKEYIEMWYEYDNKIKIWNKLKEKGIEKLSDDELADLFDAVLDEEDFEEMNIDFESIFGVYPKWLRRDQPPCSLVFLDDVYSSKVMSQMRGSSLVKFVVNGRHMLSSLIIASQSLSTIPRSIRANTSIWMVWSTKARKDLQLLLEEVINAVKSEEHFYNLMAEVEREPYGFAYLDCSSLREPFVSIGFNKPVEFK